MVEHSTAGLTYTVLLVTRLLGFSAATEAKAVQNGSEVRGQVGYNPHYHLEARLLDGFVRVLSIAIDVVLETADPNFARKKTVMDATGGGFLTRLTSVFSKLDSTIDAILLTKHTIAIVAKTENRKHYRNFKHS